jgi:hypothetical protein
MPLVRTVSQPLDMPIKSFHARRVSNVKTGMIQLDPYMYENPRGPVSPVHHLSPTARNFLRSSFNEMSVITRQSSTPEMSDDEEDDTNALELVDLEEDIQEND